MPDKQNDYEVVVYAVVCCRIEKIKAMNEKDAIKQASDQFWEFGPSLFGMNSEHRSVQFDYAHARRLKHTEMYDETPVAMFLVDEMEGEEFKHTCWYGPDGETALPSESKALGDPFQEWHNAKEKFKQERIKKETTRMAPPLKIELEEPNEKCTGIGRREHKDPGDSHN